jgi:hypothetical protein
MVLANKEGGYSKVVIWFWKFQMAFEGLVEMFEGA